ncbi:MAG: hypothetical protein ACI9LM_003086 [Alteromonadaceae bacterium]|jgi:hypothetical protein
MLLNIIGFNLSWFGLVLLGNSFIPITLLWIGLHLYLCKQRLAELTLICCVVIVGALIDSILLFIGVFEFSGRLFIPLWLVCLWAAFGATITHSLYFLEGSKILQFIIGCIFPPLSYVAGSSLSAVVLGYEPWVTFIILAPVWGAVLMMIFSLKHKLYSPGGNHA